MKNLTKSFLASLCFMLAMLFNTNVTAQQSFTSITGWNAYVHLPASYATSGQTYPTIIFFPGLGEIGTTASKVIQSGPGAYITQGWNGNVSVNGSTVEFIVISIQPPSAYPSESRMNQAIQAIKSAYRVNPNKLYLTGLSHGGWCSSTFVTGDPMGGPYTYASQIAAIVTVQGVRPDDNAPYPNLFDNFANAGGRMIGFEQRLDGRDTKTVVDRMNATKPNSAIYVQTNFGGGGHCCWQEFYGGNGTQPGNFVLDGVSQNIYQWLAKQSLGGTIPPPPPPANTPPVANAGSDKTITLPANSTTLTGSGTDANGTISSYTWTKISGPSLGTASGNSATLNVTGLAQGVYQYQLKVTDNAGATATDNVQVTVNAAPTSNQAPVANAGVDKTITLPASSISLTGSGTDADGSIVSYKWELFYGPNFATVTSSTSATATASGLIAGEYEFDLTVTDNSGASSKDRIKITVALSTGNQAPAANAGADKAITLPSNSVSVNGAGTDTDGTISSYAWTKVSGPAAGTMSNATTATLSLSGLAEGIYQYQLKVTDNGGGTATDNVQVTVNAAPAPPVSTSKSVKVNLYNGTTPYNNTQWNNWKAVSNATSSAFNYTDGTVSAIRATISANEMVVDNGSTYASAASVVPGAVLRFNSANTSNRTLTISGLDVSKQYSFEFYGSRNNTGNKTIFAISNFKDTVNTDNNVNDVAKFVNITPDNTGKVVVMLSRVGTWNYFAGLSVTEGTVAGRSAGVEPAASAVAAATTSQSIFDANTVSAKDLSTTVRVFPNPFMNTIQVDMGAEITGKYTINVLDATGKILLSKNGEKGTENKTESINATALSYGIYFLEVISNGGRAVHTLKKIIPTQY